MHVCPQCGEGFYNRKSMRKFCSRRCWALTSSVSPNRGAYKPGGLSPKRLPVGTIRVRERRTRSDGPRAWIKVADPNVWKMRAVIVWESVHGPVPPGLIVHHRNRDTLDDRIDNLEAVSRATHLNEHRPEFEKRRARLASAARWPR
jgi:hypothetical protein